MGICMPMYRPCITPLYYLKQNRPSKSKGVRICHIDYNVMCAILSLSKSIRKSPITNIMYE